MTTSVTGLVYRLGAHNQRYQFLGTSDRQRNPPQRPALLAEPHHAQVALLTVLGGRPGGILREAVMLPGLLSPTFHLQIPRREVGDQVRHGRIETSDVD